jgi:Uncharacterized protein conserved in bacteria (DUF2188)
MLDQLRLRLLVASRPGFEDGSGTTASPWCEDGGVARNTYWVMRRDRTWIVRHNDEDIASLPSRTHATAVAVHRAELDQPSEILILGPSGGIEERRTFGADELA